MKRLLEIVLAALLVALALSGCSDSQSKPGAAATALDRIKEKGVMVVGCDPTIEGINYVDPKTNEYTGMIPDMINQYAKEIGVKVQWETLEWSAMISAVNNGKVDIVAANMNRTVQRSANITFANPWLIDGAMAVVAKNSKYQSFADLQAPGIKFGISSGSVYEKIIPTIFPNAKTVVLPLGTWQDSLKSGIIDAVLDDSIVFAGPLKHNSDIRILPDRGPSYRYAFAVKQGDFAFADSLNVFLSESKSSGEYANLYKKWLGMDWKPETVGTSY